MSMAFTPVAICFIADGWLIADIPDFDCLDNWITLKYIYNPVIWELKYGLSSVTVASKFRKVEPY